MLEEKNDQRYALRKVLGKKGLLQNFTTILKNISFLFQSCQHVTYKIEFNDGEKTVIGQEERKIQCILDY